MCCLILSTDSSDDAFVPENSPLKVCVSSTKLAAERRAPTGTDVKRDYSPASMNELSV